MLRGCQCIYQVAVSKRWNHFPAYLCNCLIAINWGNKMFQALLKLVSDCSVAALNPSRKDAINESPLKIALFSLAKMCAHPRCREFIRSSDLFPVIGRLRQSPEPSISNYASVIMSKTSEAWNCKWECSWCSRYKFHFAQFHSLFKIVVYFLIKMHEVQHLLEIL